MSLVADRRIVAISSKNIAGMGVAEAVTRIPMILNSTLSEE
jgi:hypothetical protein